MQTTTVTVTRTRTIPTKPYANEKVEVTATATLEPGEDVHGAILWLHRDLSGLLDIAEAEILDPPMPEHLFGRMNAGQGSDQP